MMDPITAAPVIASIANALAPDSDSNTELRTSLLKKVLGPPADAYGLHLGQKVEMWSQSRQTKKVLELAAQKVDSTKAGRVPPRVAAAILESSQYTDDEFVAEYLSGVLASARTPEGLDDRGVSWTALVNRLSSDSLKIHYIIYSIMRREMRGVEIEVMADWCRKHIVVRYIDLLPILDLGEPQEAMRRCLDALYSLQREGLIEALTHGSASHLTGHPYGQYVLPDLGDMIIMSTTIQGVQLFLQGHGYGDVWANGIADPERGFEVAGTIEQGLSEVPGMWLESLPMK
ncbi:hypothetical protein [Arthrobacter alpinus]|nr:hypothetical protein [Arthrobacter alpinus]